MTYEQEYPNAKDGDEIKTPNDFFLVVSDVMRCFMCQARASRFISFAFEGPLCSEECTREAWKKVFAIWEESGVIEVDGIPF